MKLLVGCPIRAREWVLPLWVSHVEDACARVDIEPEYAFVIDTHDLAAEAVLRELCLRRGRVIHVLHVNEDGDRVDNRVWNESRYHHMVFLRNHLLAVVRHLEPDHFLSLDSDILIHELALPNLYETAQSFDAVGGKLYMTSMGTIAPSYANLINSAGLMRPDFDGIMAVDAIMAMKLMSPAAYAVDYRFHFMGEDIGWSLAVRAKGLRLGWDGRICSKHVMDPAELIPVDVRCGY